jgi:DNA mismatch endonuclease (patch repair protein)
MDNLTKQQRKKAMKAVKSTGTGIEKLLAQALRKENYKYRKNCKSIVGKPDFVIKNHKIAVFCDSEFWHGKNLKKTIARIGTNRDYWIQKIQNNKKRDRKVNKALKKDGWTVIRFWGKEIKERPDLCLKEISAAFKVSQKLKREKS